VDDTALTIYAASCEKLEELGYSVEERSAELEIMLMDDETPYDGEVLVKAAAFMNYGAMVPLNELAVVMDVGPVREQNVCCALVQICTAILCVLTPILSLPCVQNGGVERLENRAEGLP
jgi:hypothetical protein